MMRRTRRNPLRNLTPEQKERQQQSDNSQTRARMITMGVGAYLKRLGRCLDCAELEEASELLKIAAIERRHAEEIRAAIRREIREAEQVPEGGAVQ